VLERDSSRKKPSEVWHLSIPVQEPVFLRDEVFYSAARQLQQREETGMSRLDPAGSIMATIGNCGVPAWCEKQMTRPPEYLFLIDVPDHNEHYSQFMAMLVAGLNKEAGFGGFCKVFYYHHDPRICYEEPGGRWYYFVDLVDKWHQCRLVLCGEGQELLDPFSGAPASWLDLFTCFEQRFFLTTVKPGDWGLIELALARVFFVLPASFAGLEALPGFPGQFSGQNLKKWVAQDKHGQQWDKNLEDLKELEAWLGDAELLDWLCCCAVYPDIHWNITLHLGLSLFKGKMNEAALLKLIGLPWFRQGSMSEEMRRQLIGKLAPEKISAVRQLIIKLLEESKPESGSEAANQYKLYVAANTYELSKKKRKDRKILRQELASIPQHLLNRDLTFIHLLEGFSGVLGFILPQRFYHWFFERGLPLFGLRTGIRVTVAVVCAGMTAVLLPVPQLPVAMGSGQIVFDFVHIPDGAFLMGSPKGEKGRFDNETQHQVTLTKEFYLQQTEVTQAQWQAVMGNNPSHFLQCGSECPVEQVSWEDVQQFVTRLNEKSRDTFRLPTEAEWEYAARAGTTGPFSFGECLTTDQANYDGNLPLGGCPEGEYREQPIPVGSLKKPNNWGLHDMHGNVWEWVQDWYGGYGTDAMDPKGPESGSFRVIRGGSWFNDAWYCRAADRLRFGPGGRNFNLGFRLVLPGQQPVTGQPGKQYGDGGRN
jgi:formylglycine-generating enzyme required for sulfatase activity